MRARLFRPETRRVDHGRATYRPMTINVLDTVADNVGDYVSGIRGREEGLHGSTGCGRGRGELGGLDWPRGIVLPWMVDLESRSAG